MPETYLFILVFLSGFLIDGTAVFWVHYSEKGSPYKTAFFSIIQAIAEIIGIGSSIHDWHNGIFYIAGFGLGSFLAVKWKSKK